MTVIVGWANQGRVVMGADSAVSTEWDIELIALPKVFRMGNLMVGVAGYPRLADLLRYEASPFPADQLPADPHRAIVQTFVPWLRELVIKHGATCTSDGQTLLVDYSNIMVGLAGELFVIGSGFSVNTYKTGWTAIGAGAQYAMGALSIVNRADSASLIGDQRACVWYALEAAERFSPRVRGPFTILDSSDQQE